MLLIQEVVEGFQWSMPGSRDIVVGNNCHARNSKPNTTREAVHLRENVAVRSRVLLIYRSGVRIVFLAAVWSKS